MKELLFTESNSHLILLFVFMNHIAKSNLSLSWELTNFVQKFWPFIASILYSCTISCKKCFILNECAISCKSGFVLIQNWCEISYKKSHFVQKHETVAQENLLFRGNSSFDLNFLTSFREKKLSFCHKLKFTNPYIFATWKSKHLIFQT